MSPLFQQRVFVDEPMFERGAAATPLARLKKHREKKREQRKSHIAVLDMETDPFDNKRPKAKIHPFLAVLYSDQFETQVIWDDHPAQFVARVVAAIEALPDHFTIYAHNGGKFDWMFLVHKLRGGVSFKGRGIMSAHIGGHELRDSFHIIPEALAVYHKEKFDHVFMLDKKRRGSHKQAIIDYCISDAVYLFEIVRKFVDQFGLKLSIGQAATVELKKHYEIEKFSEGWDAYIRQYFFGGRVECLAGAGEFCGDYKLYDINSAYPRAMAMLRHPVGGMKDYSMHSGPPNDATVFLDLNCDNRGALIGRDPETNETTAQIPSGNFLTTIWEYEMALKYDLISNVTINLCLDCSKRTTFENFITPLYENRIKTKSRLDELKRAGLETSAEFFEVKSDDIFYKLLQNNAYGKQAQNPRDFKEYYLTDPDEIPPDAWLKSIQKLSADDQALYAQPLEECNGYWIWCKPCPQFTFNNVGTAASITGATRAQLLEAIQLATDPVYCDTDSLICRDLKGVEIHKTKLGAWDIEDEFSKVAIAGKKLYGGWYAKPKQIGDGQISEYKIRSKGAAGFTYPELLDLIDGKEIEKTNKGVTMTKTGAQFYITRKIRSTAKKRKAK